MARQVLDHGVIIPAEYSDDWYEDMSTNLNKLDEVIGSDADKLSEADVSEVALSGDYDDLTNKPDLKPVATSGDYDDLTNKPGYGILRMTSETLSDSGSGAISNLNSDSKLATGDYVLDAALKVFPIAAVSAPNYTVGTSLFQITNASALAAVATSGSYDDLNNLPAYGITRFVNAAITDNSNVAFANISSVDKIKAGDFLLDNAGKMYLIASVDTVNETVSVTTPLTVLALDANVMHLSGNETVAGQKTFNDLQIIGYGTQYKGSRNAYILPEFSAGYSGLSITTLSFSQTLKIGSFVLDSNNKPTLDTSKAYIQIATGESNSVNTCVLEPRNSTNSSLGTSSNKWKEINGLTPSILSLPNYAQRIDILGYITDLTGGNNTYTPLANGYIYIRTDSGLMLEILDVSSGIGSSSIVSSSDKLRIFLPVIAQRNVYIKAKCTSLVSAVFVPCFGNI